MRGVDTKCCDLDLGVRSTSQDSKCRVRGTEVSNDGFDVKGWPRTARKRRACEGGCESSTGHYGHVSKLAAVNELGEARRERGGGVEVISDMQA